MIRFDAKKLAAVALAQATKDPRKNILGVHFEPWGEGAVAVATNGHVMSVGYDPEGVAESEAILPISRKALTALKHKDAATAVFADGLLTVLSPIEQPLYLEHYAAIDEFYLDWRRVVPYTTDKPITAPAFAPDILRVLCDTAKIFGGASPLRILCDDPSGHTLVEYEGCTDLFSVAMPYRMDSFKGLPYWYEKHATE